MKSHDVMGCIEIVRPIVEHERVDFVSNFWPPIGQDTDSSVIIPAKADEVNIIEKQALKQYFIILGSKINVII